MRVCSMADLELRPMREDDLPRVLETLRLALGETPILMRTPDLWAWKHSLNPFGRSIAFVAESQEHIAGVRAMMRWQMLTPDGDILSCLRPVDTATHPDFRKRGIFRELTMTVLDVARSEGVHLVFNTPNERSAPGYLSMGWQEVDRIGVMARIRFGRSPSPPEDAPPSVADLAPRAQPLVNASITSDDRDPVGLRTPRSDNYLRWRFSAHPTASYGAMSDGEGASTVVRASSRRGQSELVVSELQGWKSGAVLRMLARSARSRYLAGWFSPGTPERRAAVHAGMLPVPGMYPLRLVALPLVDLDFDVFDLRSWDLSTSDLELL